MSGAQAVRRANAGSGTRAARQRRSVSHATPTRQKAQAPVADAPTTDEAARDGRHGSNQLDRLGTTSTALPLYKRSCRAVKVWRCGATVKLEWPILKHALGPDKRERALGNGVQKDGERGALEAVMGGMLHREVGQDPKGRR